MSPSFPCSTNWSAVIADEALLRQILEYVGPKQYRFVALVNRQWKRIHDEIHHGDTTTHFGAVLASKRTLSVVSQKEYVEWQLRWFVFQTLVEQGDLNTLRWLWARRREKRVCSSDCSTLRVRANGWSWNSMTCAAAALGGHLEVLQWAWANGCRWDRQTCWKNAAKGGHLEVLKWARLNGCRWAVETCSIAAEGGHLEVLKWAKRNKCRWNSLDCLEAARANGHKHILRWIESVTGWYEFAHDL